MIRITERKSRILRLLIVDGLSPKQIAGRLACSEKTVHWHIERIYEAFGIHRNPWVCARKAIGLGILDRTAEDFDRVLRLERLIKEVKELLRTS